MEDLDYYCVDNMPVALMPRFAELCIATGGRYENVALVTDVREKNGFGELLKKIDQLKEMNCSVRILYMDADVRTIVRRYKESRRPHPLAAPRSRTPYTRRWICSRRYANGRTSSSTARISPSVCSRTSSFRSLPRTGKSARLT